MLLMLAFDFKILTISEDKNIIEFHFKVYDRANESFSLGEA